MTLSGWVVGARGLLGRATSARLRRDDQWSLFEPAPLPWNDDDELSYSAEASLRALIERSTSESSTGWAVFWTAGTVVTSSPPAAMADELRQFALVLDAFERALVDNPHGGAGCIFFASSAGGVYGGSVNPPFDEYTAPAPISPYGVFKLDAEAMLGDFSRRTGVSTVVGRIANLYGPGQRLEKMQGIISHIARAQFSPTPASIYVPLETLRDYIYVDDCAALIGDLTRKALETTSATGTIQITKNLISGQAVTISTLLGYFRILAKGHPHVMLGASSAAALQAVDLRLASVIWPELDQRELTTLPAGIQATIADIFAGIQAGATAR